MVESVTVSRRSRSPASYSAASRKAQRTRKAMRRARGIAPVQRRCSCGADVSGFRTRCKPCHASYMREYRKAKKKPIDPIVEAPQGAHQAPRVECLPHSAQGAMLTGEAMKYGIIQVAGWTLGRPRVDYPGAYPSGFLERARPLLGCSDPEKVIWHIPGGMAHKYNGGPEEKGGITLTGYGKNDLRIDLAPECEPEILLDIRFLDRKIKQITKTHIFIETGVNKRKVKKFSRPHAIIIDRDYDENFAERHSPGRKKWPKQLNKLLYTCAGMVLDNHLVGVLDPMWPSRGNGRVRQVFHVDSVSMGANNRGRFFTVWKAA